MTFSKHSHEHSAIITRMFMQYSANIIWLAGGAVSNRQCRLTDRNTHIQIT